MRHAQLHLSSRLGITDSRENEIFPLMMSVVYVYNKDTKHESNLIDGLRDINSNKNFNIFVLQV